MHIAMIAPLNKRIVNLFGALYTNHGSKIDLQELASNKHICWVEGHIVAIETKDNASENRLTYEGGVLLVIDASALIPRISHAVQIRYIKYSPFSFKDE